MAHEYAYAKNGATISRANGTWRTLVRCTLTDIMNQGREDAGKLSQRIGRNTVRVIMKLVLNLLVIIELLELLFVKTSRSHDTTEQLGDGHGNVRCSVCC